MKLTCSFATQAEELAKVLSQMKLILQGTQGMFCQAHRLASAFAVWLILQ